MPDSPPPYVHRRETDVEQIARQHQRWYDGWRGVMIIVASLAGAVGVGYSLNDFVSTVRETPTNIRDLSNQEDARYEENLAEHNRMWQAINRGAEERESISQRLDSTISLLLEAICMESAETPQDRRNCMSASTRQRIEEILRQRGTSIP